jgi:hypothetical protein
VGGGIVRALFQALAPEGHAEVGPISGVESMALPGGGPSTGVPQAGISMNLGWMWTNGIKPIAKTKRIIMAADGTVFFVRSMANFDQFYFISPASSRVRLTITPTMPGRPPAIIDVAHRYAESDGNGITVRPLNPAVSADAEFLELLASAKLAADAAGLGSE